MASPNFPDPSQAPPPAPPKVKVSTTWPVIPPHADRVPIRTERLLLRPMEAADAEAVSKLRTQPEVMQWTKAGVVDANLDETRASIARFLPPNDLISYNFVVEYVGTGGADGDGVVVGTAGVHRADPATGWPEIGYMFRKEYWNMGLGTEFVRAFTRAWWALPRKTIELEVEEASVRGRAEKANGHDDGSVTRVPEILMALIAEGNAGSRRVLEKAGFTEYSRWYELDSRAGLKGSHVTLVTYLIETPNS